MINSSDQRPYSDLLRMYQEYVYTIHPKQIDRWPLLSGWDCSCADFNDWEIIVFRDKPFTNSSVVNGIESPSSDTIGYSAITNENRGVVRTRLENHYAAGPKDVVVLIPPDRDVGPEIIAMLQRHEVAIGVSAMKIFLSHKGVDKGKVRDFRNTLRLLGFDPWLDEDAMPAGTTLDRGILEGFESSCAVVFFVTPKFVDEGYLAAEVDYAISEKRNKKDKFSIITLVFGEGDTKGSVPDLLRRYVWKEPKSDLEALQEIVKSLPIQVGAVHWRSPKS